VVGAEKLSVSTALPTICSEYWSALTGVVWVTPPTL
jgi:hypothetical protein